MQTSTTIIYKIINVKHLNLIYNLSTLIELIKHKHLVFFSNHEYSTTSTRCKQNENKYVGTKNSTNKVFGPKSILNMITWVKFM